ncbi:MAG: ribonuclease Z [Flavobacteriales bacterium]
MRRFELLTLGTGAALPARGRYPTAQLLNVHEGLFLIDCGEGTQERLREQGVNFQRIERIFISHLHGDHYLGLQGLISSMHLMGRRNPLHVHGPQALKGIVDVQLRASETYLRYPLHIHINPSESGTLVHADHRVEVTALALKHRIPTTGFLFRERQAPPSLRRERVHEIPHYLRDPVKQGADLVLPDGRTVPNAELTLPAPPARSYAYCSDTAYAPELLPHLLGVDLLYHEATFTEQLIGRARETMHSTAAQAATLAREAGVRQLLLGHFSSRYKSEQALLAEALAVFPNTRAAREGERYLIPERTGVDNL